MSEDVEKLKQRQPLLDYLRQRIAVGLHPVYNAAQQLYAKRGYILDGRGITYRNRFVEEGKGVVVDDDLVLHFTKQFQESDH